MLEDGTRKQGLGEEAVFFNAVMELWISVIQSHFLLGRLVGFQVEDAV